MNAVTCHTEFHVGMLSVRAGIPEDDALNQASCLMAQALDISTEVADSADDISEMLFGLVHLIETSKAYLDAVIVGRVRRATEPD